MSQNAPTASPSPRDEHDEEIWQEAFAEGWARGQSTMRAEIERLRAALREIADYSPGKDTTAMLLRGHARAALEPKT